jgi:hypothetical protein
MFQTKLESQNIFIGIKMVETNLECVGNHTKPSWVLIWRFVNYNHDSKEIKQTFYKTIIFYIFFHETTKF